VGVLPFALALDTLLLHALFVALLAIWAGYEVFGFAAIGPWRFGVPGGAYSLIPLAAPGIWWAYRRSSAQALALYVPLIAWWVILQPIAWRLEANLVYFIGAMGGLLLLAAEAHREGSAMALPYRVYGAGLFAGALIPLSYYAFNDRNIRGAAFPGFYEVGAILALAVMMLATVAVVRRRAQAEPVPVSLSEELWEIAHRQWLPCSLITLMAGLGAWTALGYAALLPTVAANAAMVILALWLMRVGLTQDQGKAFSAGVLYFLLWTVLRYIDLFGEFGGMIGAALMFFLCGATLFGVALFWRHRKEVRLA
jgi:hypothetical protein